MMTPTELLKPRYEVIADYPDYTNSLYIHKKGDVIVFDDSYSVILWKEIGSDGTICYEEDFRKYPAIFRPLAWWEHRKPEDMPAYLRYGDLDKAHRFYEIKEAISTEYNITGYWAVWPEDFCLPLSIGHNVWPATKDEYEVFIKTDERYLKLNP